MLVVQVGGTPLEDGLVDLHAHDCERIGEHSEAIRVERYYGHAADRGKQQKEQFARSGFSAVYEKVEGLARR